MFFLNGIVCGPPLLGQSAHDSSKELLALIFQALFHRSFRPDPVLLYESVSKFNVSPMDEFVNCLFPRNHYAQKMGPGDPSGLLVLGHLNT